MPDGLPPDLIVTQPLAKAWWRSRTLWLNLVVLMLAAVETQLQVLQPLIPGDVWAWVAFVLPVLNVALRAVTTQPVSLSDPSAAPVAYRAGFEPTQPLPDDVGHY